MENGQYMQLYAVFEGEGLTSKVLKLFEIDKLPGISLSLTKLRVKVRPEPWPCRCGVLLKLFPVAGPIDVNINEFPFEPKIELEIEEESNLVLKAVQ